MSRKVHDEGMRERQNMRENSTKHQSVPKYIDSQGRARWCCPGCMDKSNREGLLDEWLQQEGYEFDEERGRYTEIEQ